MTYTPKEQEALKWADKVHSDPAVGHINWLAPAMKVLAAALRSREDRIKELESQAIPPPEKYQELFNNWTRAEARAKELETKLGKAVEDAANYEMDKHKAERRVKALERKRIKKP